MNHELYIINNNNLKHCHRYLYISGAQPVKYVTRDRFKKKYNYYKIRFFINFIFGHFQIDVNKSNIYLHVYYISIICNKIIFLV